jgi:hypothetical protein
VAGFPPQPLDTWREVAETYGMTYTDAELQALGAAIRRLRERHWKGPEFARLVGISTTHLSSIELGRRPAHPSVYQRIADQLGVALDDLEREEAGAA